MNRINSLIIVFSLCFFSCTSQNSSTITFDYKAQTRGFKYLIKLENDSLMIVKNGKTINKVLTNNKEKQLTQYFSEINFDEIKSNSVQENLQVDKEILGDFYLLFKGKTYAFKFNHNNLPKPISGLFKNLESL